MRLMPWLGCLFDVAEREATRVPPTTGDGQTVEEPLTQIGGSFFLVLVALGDPCSGISSESSSLQ